MIENFQVKTECAVCPTKIWGLEGTRLKKTKEYHEADVQLSDASTMAVGVCSRHAKPSTADLNRMTEKVHQGWLEEAALGIGNDSWIQDKGLKLRIVGVRA